MTDAALRIERIEIKDFRGISHLALDLTDGAQPLDRVVLAGPNGSGKTSVLEAIALGLGAGELLPADSAPLPEQVRFGAEEFEVRLGVWRHDHHDELATNSSILALPRKLMGRDGRRLTNLEHTARKFWAEAQGLGLKVDYHSARREPEQLGVISTTVVQPPEREALRLAWIKRWLVALRTRAAVKSRPLDPASPFLRLQKFWQEFTGDPRVIDVIEKGGDGPDAPDAEVVLRDASRVIPDDINSLAQARRLASKRQDIPAMVPIDRLSSGQVALLTFAGALLFRDEPLDVLLIDEPEQHLHAEWHFHLLGALRRLSPQTQIIVGTHSADILTSALSYERRILSRDGSRAEHGEDPLAEATDESHESERDEAAE